jgi:hypothetical protein
MALFRVSSLPAGCCASPPPPEELFDQNIVSWASARYRNPTARRNWSETSGGVKRLARRNPRTGKVEFEHLIPAMMHDSSASNSGSAILDVTTGQIVGLHRRGSPRELPVPMFEPPRDRRCRCRSHV